MKTEDMIKLAALAAAGYVVYRLLSAASSAAAAAAGAVGAAASAVNSAYQTTVAAVGSGLYAVFGPTDKSASMYYIVNFPDGNRHAVPSNTVDSSGNFLWTGYPPGSSGAITLTLVKDSAGAWYATTDS